MECSVGTVDPRAFVFIHVHKTAGTSLHMMLREIYGGVMFTPSPKYRYPDGHNDWVGYRGWEIQQAYDAASDAEKNRILAEVNRAKCFGGHITWQIAQLVQQEAFVMTTLRDPVDRLVSYYFHHKFGKGNRLEKEAVRGMAFDAYVEFDAIKSRTDNRFTRVLADVPDHRRVNEADLEKALERLASLDAILFQHRFDAGLKRIGQHLGWPAMEVPRARVSKKRVEFADLIPDDPASMPAVNRLVQFDTRLFQAAKSMPNALI